MAESTRERPSLIAAATAAFMASPAYWLIAHSELASNRDRTKMQSKELGREERIIIVKV
jgi:hypothetical protein